MRCESSRTMFRLPCNGTQFYRKLKYFTDCFISMFNPCLSNYSKIREFLRSTASKLITNESSFCQVQVRTNCFSNLQDSLIIVVSSCAKTLFCDTKYGLEHTIQTEARTHTAKQSHVQRRAASCNTRIMMISTNRTYQMNERTKKIVCYHVEIGYSINGSTVGALRIKSTLKTALRH